MLHSPFLGSGKLECHLAARRSALKVRGVDAFEPVAHEVPVVGARLHNGAHATLQRDLGEDVVAQVAQHSAGVGQLGAADLVARHHADELKDVLPAGDEARAQHVVHAEGLGGRGGRRGGVAAASGNCWRSSRSFRINEPVAVVGYAQAVRGLAVGGGGKVGADPGGQPGARVRAFEQQRPVQRAQRGVNPVEVAAPVRGQKAAFARSTSKSLSEPATLLRLST